MRVRIMGFICKITTIHIKVGTQTVQIITGTKGLTGNINPVGRKTVHNVEQNVEMVNPAKQKL
jgi:hypothetical protein